MRRQIRHSVPAESPELFFRRDTESSISACPVRHSGSNGVIASPALLMRDVAIPSVIAALTFSSRFTFKNLLKKRDHLSVYHRHRTSQMLEIEDLTPLQRLSFPPRIYVRDKLQRESSPLFFERVHRIEEYLYIVLIFMFIACNHNDPQYAAPDFTLPDVYGNQVNLYSLLDQGPVVFVPWALWCKMTIKELDALKPYEDTLHLMRIHILAVSQDKSKSVPKVLPFAISHDWVCHYRILLDTANVIRDLYDIQAMPSTIAIDMSGDIVYRHEGYKTGDEVIIIDTLKALFGE